MCDRWKEPIRHIPPNGLESSEVQTHLIHGTIDGVETTFGYDASLSLVSTRTDGYRNFYAFLDLTASAPIESVSVGTLASGGDDAIGCEPLPYQVVRAKAQLLVKTGGDVYAGTGTHVGGSTYDAVSYTWTTNPARGQPWTAAEVNALHAGVELVAANWIARVPQVYVAVVEESSAVYTYATGPTGMSTLTSLVKNDVTTSFTYDANGNRNTKTGGWTDN